MFGGGGTKIIFIKRFTETSGWLLGIILGCEGRGDCGDRYWGNGGQSEAVIKKAKRASTADENDSAKPMVEEDTGEQVKQAANDNAMDVDQVAKDGEREGQRWEIKD